MASEEGAEKDGGNKDFYTKELSRFKELNSGPNWHKLDLTLPASGISSLSYIFSMPPDLTPS